MSHHRSHPSDYLRVLYRRRWTAGVTFLLVLAYGAAGSLRKAPVYEASAQLLIEGEGQARALTSRELAWRTIEGLGLGRAPADANAVATLGPTPETGLIERLAVWLGAPRPVEVPAGDETAWQARQIDAFLDGVVVSPAPNSRLVTLTYRSEDPVFAAKAANALAERSVDQAQTYRTLAAGGNDAFENEQLTTQRQRLAESEIALYRYTQTNGIPSLAARLDSPAARRIADASAELTRARLTRLDQDALAQRWTVLRNELDDFDAFPALRSDEAAQALWESIVELRTKDGHLAAAGYGRDRDERRRLAAALDKKSDELQERIEPYLRAVRVDAEAAREQEAALRRQYDTEVGQIQGRDKAVVEYVALERTVLGDRQLHDHLVQRAKAAGTLTAGAAAGVQVLEAASVPRKPTRAARGSDLGLALLWAALLAVGLAFGTEFLDSRIKNPDDVKTHLRMPFLGLVPAVSARHARGGGLLLNRAVPPRFGEALRAVRTAVIFSSASEGAKSLMVTSTAPSEGKTVTASNLAMSLAQTDLRTLIVDGDMRRPRIHEVFHVDQEPGLSNVLVGTATLADAVRPTENPHLFVLPAGHLPPNPAELLSSPRYRRLLEELGEQYDWIVIDAPPVMAVTDAAVVAHEVSGVVFVIGAEMIPRRNAQYAIDQLVQARAKIIGIVLNRAEVERHAYYFAPYERKEYAPVDAPRL
jgi:capsular exopolysaccharide synthesis family protein